MNLDYIEGISLKSLSTFCGFQLRDAGEIFLSSMNIFVLTSIMLRDGLPFWEKSD